MKLKKAVWIDREIYKQFVEAARRAGLPPNFPLLEDVIRATTDQLNSGVGERLARILSLEQQLAASEKKGRGN